MTTGLSPAPPASHGQANAAIFAGQGKAIDAYASKHVKVLVVGNPANTNAVITMTNAPSIPKYALSCVGGRTRAHSTNRVRRARRRNFTALTRLDQNRATSLLASMLAVPASSVGPVVVWGNHSRTQFPDARFTTVAEAPGNADRRSSIAAALVACGKFPSAAAAQEWLGGQFVSTVQQRGTAVIAKRGASSAGSAANAICDHVRDWIFGTAGRVVSMGVVTNGTWYGLPEGLVFSLPVTIDSAGEYKVVEDLGVSMAEERIAATTAELVKERETALGLGSSHL